MQIPVPIIIINWRGIEDTLECMESVLQQEDIDFHVHLVDNGSEDHSPDVLKEKFSKHEKVSLHLLPDNLGFTGGNNLIMDNLLKQYSDTELPHIILLNNDTTVEKNWLKNLVAAAEETGAGMVSSRMVYYYDRKLMDNAGHYMLNTGEILPVGYFQPPDHYNQRTENMGACGGAVLYNTQMLRDIGLFDDHFSTGYEDAELGLRAVVCQYTCMYEPTAIVYHKGGQSLKKVRNLDYLVNIQSHILYTYFKLMPDKFLLQNMPLLFARYLMIFTFDLLFIRKKYLIMHSKAWWLLLTKNFREGRIKRKILFQNRKIAESKELFQKVEFFWHTDARRLRDYLRTFWQKKEVSR